MKRWKRRGKMESKATVCWRAAAIGCGLVFLVGMRHTLQGLVEKLTEDEKDENFLSERYVKCLYMRKTGDCTPWGPLRGRERCNKKMSDVDRNTATFCECIGGWTTKHLFCGMVKPNLTCEEACTDLFAHSHPGAPDVLRLHKKLNCSNHSLMKEYSRSKCNASLLDRSYVETDEDFRYPTVYDNDAKEIWMKIAEAYRVTGDRENITSPSRRTKEDDFVKDGLRMPPDSVAAARKQWMRFLGLAPTYREVRHHFDGKGIVMVAGGSGKYLLPALVNVNFLRHVGCNLPIEIWIPFQDRSPCEVVDAFALLDATVRILDKLPFLPQQGFSLKAASIVLSSFQQVLFLDSDSISVHDPAYLFQTDEYREQGAVLWPDFWNSTIAPDLLEVLGLTWELVPTGSHESGQMMFDKARTWDGLLLALFMNLKHHLYFDLLTDYLGWGDKESFAFGQIVTGKSYHRISAPVRSAGIPAYNCTDPNHPWHCRMTKFYGNTMVQHDPYGRVLFMHVNMPPKFSLHIVDSFMQYIRRWQVIFPGNIRVQDALRWSGVDAERLIYDILVDISCMPDSLAIFPEEPSALETLTGDRLTVYGPHLSHGIDLSFLMSKEDRQIERNITFADGYVEGDFDSSFVYRFQH